VPAAHRDPERGNKPYAILASPPIRLDARHEPQQIFQIARFDADLNPTDVWTTLPRKVASPLQAEANCAGGMGHRKRLEGTHRVFRVKARTGAVSRFSGSTTAQAKPVRWIGHPTATPFPAS
jgi:hypothetical protein